MGAFRKNQIAAYQRGMLRAIAVQIRQLADKWGEKDEDNITLLDGLVKSCESVADGLRDEDDENECEA